MLLYGEALYGPEVTGNHEDGRRLLRQAAGQGGGICQFVVARVAGWTDGNSSGGSRAAPAIAAREGRGK